MKKLFALIGLLGLVAGMGGALNAQEEAGDTQKLDTIILYGNFPQDDNSHTVSFKFSATPGEKFVIRWGDYYSRYADTILVENANETEKTYTYSKEFSNSRPHFDIGFYALTHSGHIKSLRIDSTYKYTNLTFKNCMLLDTLQVVHNTLEDLNIMNCPTLKFLDISHNKLTGWYQEITSALTYLDCSHNDIKHFTKKLSSLRTFDISYNRELCQFILYNCQSLTDLTVRCNDSLETLELSNLPLQHLTCTENQKLSRINANNCRFQTLDVSGNPALKMLFCNNNRLTSLTFNDCHALTFIDCSYNQLSHIDLSPCENFQDLYCRNNRFSVLDIPENMILKHLDCDSNHIPLSALVDLVGRVRYRDNVTQVLTVAPILQVGEFLDLRDETHLSDCHQCERYTIFSDGQPIEERISDGVQDDYGLIKFDKAGNYRLHLRSDLLYEREEDEDEEWQYYITISAYYDLTVVDSVVRPQFSIPSGAVLPDTALVLSTPTPDARIYYTTDGTEPEGNALLYQEPIHITEAVTIKAIAIRDTFKSHIAIATYTIDTVARPTFSIPSGAVVWPDTTLILSTATPNAKIYYTIDGGEPDEAALPYTAPIRITEAMTVKAVAVYKTVKSQVTAASYAIDTVARPMFSIPSGTVVGHGTALVLNTVTPNAKIYYTTDASEPDETTLAYTAPIRITEAMTVKAVAIYKTLQSQVATATYTVDSVANEHDLRVSKLRVYAKDRTIYLSETVGEVEVFTVNGTCVYRGYDTAISVERSGIYVVSVVGRRWKVAVR